MSAECAGTRVFSVYVPNGRALDNEFYEVKLAWLARLRGDTRPDLSPRILCRSVR